jgi:hypothetical protein
MAKSRTAPFLFLLLVPAPAVAQTAPPDELVEAQRRQLREAIRADCPPAGDSDEIVVCGSRGEDRHRLPLPAGPGSSLAANRAGGEQRAALGIDSSRCSTVGPNPQCTQGLDVIGIAFTVARAVAQALIKRD